MIQDMKKMYHLLYHLPNRLHACRTRLFMTTAFLLAIAMHANATAQEGNIIIIDGERWTLLNEPIYADTALFHRMKAALPADRSWTTANWDGYTSYWSIRQGSLMLDSICVTFYNEETEQFRQVTLDESWMKRLFKGYTRGKGFKAALFSGKLRVTRGECIHYVHDGYESSFEYETFFTVKAGKVTERKDYHNRLIEGCSFGKSKDLIASLKEKLLLQAEKYPELNEAKRILFNIKDVKLDSTGTITDCTVTALRNGSDDIAKEMKRIIMDIHPWETLYLYDEYVFPERGGYTFPITISKYDVVKGKKM